MDRDVDNLKTYHAKLERIILNQKLKFNDFIKKN